ncbi:hypothetical protein [Alteromonas sp. ASW11-130]|uniref:hypothetical protein n=1 Tax=Alteromonas sp. ASW11-130 TaxID=3015775 RepID=UPI00224201E3|nr:hypothetical protein [Alteromonas sp. ASW11-130]MCW8091017.1 hypothetical protein [Alteromonas sp. ASW11-130]
MFYFKLYRDKRLKNLKYREKVQVVNRAVKLYRKDKPVKLTSRLLGVLVWCGIPASILFFMFSWNAAIGLFPLFIFILEIKTANDESGDVRKYLHQVVK